ncbi:Putative periplasmic nitrate reductase NapD [Bradyrhizobium sp. ORS 285]|uniref:chaperone NapD n=1 Tax=Bradyrhizobium sp. ORS 285 TaxID=115808 RepID=UPI0002406E12|nr:chaperone NapD [Bradyrhizobium sp. ORS 285]CCD89591.1 putative periplasmic nitrate reductase NapD [Bradyrhizobium sp. ORS 285]SMX56258.1 Putative periplasmic nitrate reductase NapD [Bradyrhizobium sp. ORS 285]
MLNHRTSFDRRALITGRVLTAEPVVTPPAGEIASIIVQTRPDQLDRVAADILALDGCEIHARDVKGKLIVVVDAPDAGALGATMNRIGLLPNVHSACLVFHAIDAG